MQELTELDEGDELHITIEGGKTIPLAVGGTEKRKVWLDYDGQRYARVTPSDVTNDDYDYTLMTLHGDEDELVGVENIEVQD